MFSTLYNVQHTVQCSANCTMFSTLYNVRCAMYSVQCKMYKYCVQITVYTVQCVQCTVCSVHAYHQRGEVLRCQVPDHICREVINECLWSLPSYHLQHNAHYNNSIPKPIQCNWNHLFFRINDCVFYFSPEIIFFLLDRFCCLIFFLLTW